MKAIKTVNRWIIKEKRLEEIPAMCGDNQGYAVFAPDGRWTEDNLTYEQAIEFCKNNLDWIKK